MDHVALPLPLAKGVLKIASPRLLDASLRALLQRIGERHPRLISNLGRLNEALVRFDVTDLPHAFALSFGGQKEPELSVVPEDDSSSYGAVIRGSLESLLAMLEGNVDGDTLFFSRDITVTGDSEIVVGLRNTLDREALGVMEEVLSFFGPFARPVGLSLALADKVAHRIKRRIARIHESLHEGDRP